MEKRYFSKVKLLLSIFHANKQKGQDFMTS